MVLTATDVCKHCLTHPSMTFFWDPFAQHSCKILLGRSPPSATASTLALAPSRLDCRRPQPHQTAWHSDIIDVISSQRVRDTLVGHSWGAVLLEILMEHFSRALVLINCLRAPLQSACRTLWSHTLVKDEALKKRSG